MSLTIHSKIIRMETLKLKRMSKNQIKNGKVLLYCEIHLLLQA
jgi:hypothetical protein